MSGHKCSYPWDLQDRYAQDKSVVNKMQQKYWETKQAFIKATGKKEDEHVVASDADLDAKLELFHSIQRTCLDLSKAIVLYQKRICFLSQEENELGKFLRSQGFQDKTRAGKMMQATGKALCFSSQQRLALRNPLCRFHQEVETFRHRAISDTWLTVNRMEQCRTEYRGALLWMKDVSQELDPDLYKQMEKFRKVQTQVRLAKKSFDKLKMDVCQKVDLLGASRCNLLSHMLATYQTTLLHFWEKTSHTMAAIHESFRGYQPYEFTTLKSLQDPMKKLVEKEERKKITQQESAEAAAEGPSQLISLEEEHQHMESSSFKTEEGKRVLSALDKSSTHHACSDELLNMKPEEGACLGPMGGTPELEGADKDDLLLLNEIFNASSLEEGDFSKEWAAVFGDSRLKEPAPTVAPGEPDPKLQTGSGFLPSQLLDQNMKDLQASLYGPPTPWPASKANSANASSPTVKEPTKATSDLTAWFSLFADLDPLSNPDAVGKTDKEHELLNA
ncbi:islet cell autoantigen 1 [Rhinolophus ferrumequinum]|uniref:Islet cell autoantigen 1 n=1 Tax=Rhinolophus ferrumequinum TaxID=59479 RepID=A0A671FQ04_RHIFE|nr:islet cell autoantigen 1 isoform X1 [Rhinolophus ferrumequinum]XP_032944374.1 islet cell autoantigen 1 isoform X1 [Rhinolophus ferrumequinum]XP_032944375.1 islet cell autoantigen 1 isoform X1 [Rhinolophus ferrumequinum]XP_032944376.1 islet cell autoantigen 1 isoform X1 [Rhinolophus ferrumequinum]XP_032944377.1 islet cell autoantigen 1 isoform X1 [Rhinolophus ferrumequinum]KAF6301765.1 islet cell autoantigen 1 [Rhinolophus ferrumequinum]